VDSVASCAAPYEVNWAELTDPAQLHRPCPAGTLWVRVARKLRPILRAALASLAYAAGNVYLVLTDSVVMPERQP
jgi:hypothetical protein